MLLLILGVALVAAAFGLLAHAVALPRLRTAERLAAIDAYGYPAEAPDEEQREGFAPALDRLARRLGAAAMPRLGESGPELRVLLLSAGAYGVGAEAFLGYRLLGAVGEATLVARHGGDEFVVLLADTADSPASQADSTSRSGPRWSCSRS